MHDSDSGIGIDSGIIALLTGIGIGIGIKHLDNSWNRNRNRNQTFGKLLESESEPEILSLESESESDIFTLIPTLKLIVSPMVIAMTLLSLYWFPSYEFFSSPCFFF